MRFKPQTYALAAVTYQRRRIFQRTENAELFIATLFRYRDAGKFRLHAFVVMPDHIHVLITPAPAYPHACLPTAYNPPTSTPSKSELERPHVISGPAGMAWKSTQHESDRLHGRFRNLQ